jgi:hypothetical protein
MKRLWKVALDVNAAGGWIPRAPSLFSADFFVTRPILIKLNDTDAKVKSRLRAVQWCKRKV